MTSSVRLTVYFPLLGLAFDHLEAAALDQMALFCKPYPEEWRFVCQSDVWYEAARETDLIFDEYAVPTCIQLISGITPGADLGPLLHRQYRAGWDSVLILRLFKPGWFLSPHLYQVGYSTTEGQYGREPGPYRQIQSEQFAVFADGLYRIGLSELLSAENRGTAPISTTAHLVRQSRATGGDSSLEYAVRNFHLSYSLYVSWAQRCGHLFTALDTMLGGMSARAIGETPLKTRFRERVLLLLQYARLDDPEGDTDWLDNGSSGGRHIRNNIAHGNPDAVEDLSHDAYPGLQRMVRVILKQYLAFKTLQHRDPETVAKAFGRSRCRSTAEGFNGVLERALQGDERATILMAEMGHLGYSPTSTLKGTE